MTLFFPHLAFSWHCLRAMFWYLLYLMASWFSSSTVSIKCFNCSSSTLAQPRSMKAEPTPVESTMKQGHVCSLTIYLLRFLGGRLLFLHSKFNSISQLSIFCDGCYKLSQQRFLSTAMPWFSLSIKFQQYSPWMQPQPLNVFQVRFLDLRLTLVCKGNLTWTSHTGCGVSLESSWWARFHGRAKTYVDWVWHSS